MVGVKRSSRKNGPTFAFSQKYFSSKYLEKLKLLMLSEAFLREAVTEAPALSTPNGMGFEQKRRKAANLSAMAGMGAAYAPIGKARRKEIGET
mmetsp:Transcript_62365/g.158568  ORF Transcript_62365/g.158568 Transcript_62365/m.158568 type:complete len:93 (+) Transcript_62365:320-598(+)